ncbi:MAG: 2-succinylbenzoate--CoA ligase [Kastovskya adunca ATA6-11-RM4]|jgi:O-succinylbenzoic acid--CoA ligase|nr:2-succinylbenzoate--CoA ligase [Kastovskya adunca ATA6-11-RM4]
METPLTYLKQRADQDWLVGYDSQKFRQLSQEFYEKLISLGDRPTPPKILIAESEPLHFLASFIAACAADCHVFLCNPHWVEQEWQQVFDLVQPHLVLGNILNSDTALLKKGDWGDLTSSKPAQNLSPSIMIPTGGSSGKIKFAIHTWETLMASVGGFAQYFAGAESSPASPVSPEGTAPGRGVNSFCVLPLYHVSGLMQFLRSFTTGGKLVILPFKRLIEKGDRHNIDPSEFFISLVPTQLVRLLQIDAAWLSRFHTVLLGGAPAWQELLDTARRHSIRLASTYGMTETASQVVTLKPEDFLAGNTSCGQVLPHAKVTIQSETGEVLATNQTGIVTIQSNSLAWGYYPEFFSKSQPFQTDDLGFFDHKGYLTIVGRRSQKIITGGENVFPAEVEAAIQATQLVTDICVIGLPDLQWGQVVTAVYVPRSLSISVADLQAKIVDKLSKFKRPKYWVAVESLPRNSQGKVNCEELKQLTISFLMETQ